MEEWDGTSRSRHLIRDSHGSTSSSSTPTGKPFRPSNLTAEDERTGVPPGIAPEAALQTKENIRPRSVLRWADVCRRAACSVARPGDQRGACGPWPWPPDGQRHRRRIRLFDDILKRERAGSTFSTKAWLSPCPRAGIENAARPPSADPGRRLDVATDKPIELIFLLLSPAETPDIQVSCWVGQPAAQNRRLLQILRTVQTPDEALQPSGLGIVGRAKRLSRIGFSAPCSGRRCAPTADIARIGAAPISFRTRSKV